MAVIPTPNLAQMADPYADDVFNNMWRSAYGFKDTVRTDYLKDQYVPAKELGAQLDYLNNQFALDSASSTYGARLASDFYGAELGAMGAADDYAMYPAMRGLQDQAALYGATEDVLSAEESVAQRQAEIERRAAINEANQRTMAAVGSTPWDRATNAYTASLDDPSTPPQVREVLRANMIDILQRQLAILPPGSPEYNNIRMQLITYGGYGVQQDSRRPRFNAPQAAPTGPAVQSPRLSYGSYR